MNNSIQYRIFKNGSKTYFNSSLFFPPEIRKDVFTLYAFVRVADNFVDAIPQQKELFVQFKNDYARGIKQKQSSHPIIGPFIELSQKKNFPQEWTGSFLKSMEMDLTKKSYDTLDETLEYIYGSAEVIGLFMASIMDLPEHAFHSAKMLGRSMQYINFIRDIEEDNQLGRRYLPLSGTKLPSLQEKDARNNKEEFISFITSQIDLYKSWQTEAEKGFPLIPKRFRIPIKTASDMYNWTGIKIKKDPFIIYKKKMKPSKFRIIRSILLNAIKER